MCGSSAAKSYGSLGSSCAMRQPPRMRADLKIRNTCVGTDSGGPEGPQLRTSVRRGGRSGPPELEMLLDGEHPVERNAVPVLLLSGHRHLVVHAPLDQLVQDPEQMVRGHTEHGRTEAAELVERMDDPV